MAFDEGRGPRARRVGRMPAGRRAHVRRHRFMIEGHGRGRLRPDLMVREGPGACRGLGRPGARPFDMSGRPMSAGPRRARGYAERHLTEWVDQARLRGLPPKSAVASASDAQLRPGWPPRPRARRQRPVAVAGLELAAAAARAGLVAAPRGVLHGVDAHDLGRRPVRAQERLHVAHGSGDVPEEGLVAGAQVVQPGLAVGVVVEAVLGAAAVAGEAHVALPAEARQRVALVAGRSAAAAVRPRGPAGGSR